MFNRRRFSFAAPVFEWEEIVGVYTFAFATSGRGGGNLMRQSMFSKVFTAAAIIGAIFTTGCSNKKPPDPMASVSGTATSHNMKELSPDAVAYVRLADITKDGVQGKTVLQKSFKPGGTDEAMPFELRFKAKNIDPKRDYALDVRIVENGELVYITRGAKPVLTKGHPSALDVKLEQPGSH